MTDIRPGKPALPAEVLQLDAFFESADITRRTLQCDQPRVIFAQGDLAADVYYLQRGCVRLSVLSRTGKEAIVATLEPGAFFGERCLAGQPRRSATATALAGSTVMAIAKPQMLELLRTKASLSACFLSHMLTRNIQIEEDLVDQLFNRSEKRLARTLLQLARYGTEHEQLELPKLSQETLAGMVGTTRSRVNFFMNKFRDLGFIDYSRSITVNSSLLNIVLHD